MDTAVQDTDPEPGRTPRGADTAVLSEAEAESYIGGICFKTGPPRRVGVELEWHVRDRDDPARAVPGERLDAVLAPLLAPGALPGGSRITREPGGQLEVSSAPGDSLTDCVTLAAADLAVVRQALAPAGAVLHGGGLNPFRTPPRVLDHPRYRAMEAHFDRHGPWGRVMMRSTAAVQISLDAGDDGDGPTGYRHRWRLAHRLGPVLVAAFANSPTWRGRETGWASTRQRVWSRTDPARTRPPHPEAPPREEWARYALDAPLLCLRRGEEDGRADWSAPPRLTFRNWLRGGYTERPPTRADLDYHLSTLFPPVRPRGWLELRMIDAQPGDGWLAALAVAATLLDDPRAAAAADAATRPLAERTAGPGLWLRAARHGPADPLLGPVVRECVDAAESALAAGVPDSPAHRAVAEFAERHTRRGRCPADDQRRDGPGPGTPRPDAPRGAL
ncbi:ergothioneine biosynthesis glutamate--cysteine ligase EgtA [Streptomyces sp. TRM 70351]|uniref:ergothioneine biosynthesis glutamate--cysteine ligase EgtA n=1 Tax=Streptomyces sp. TRM 70351 TaxID=3116552 RepID=UPI002E7B0B67|nr:ergothioneine biosynthesis glutamate--cysteine ligase EgtA [Streptomyces sp. TRM 70351]MEE1930341.1 ergothioneine biosynthesis glutamate--cysteine ligase EgtA [Streptomyces sp. TRM 70351]